MEKGGWKIGYEDFVIEFGEKRDGRWSGKRGL